MPGYGSGIPTFPVAWLRVCASAWPIGVSLQDSSLLFSCVFNQIETSGMASKLITDAFPKVKKDRPITQKEEPRKTSAFSENGEVNLKLFLFAVN